MVGAAGVVFTTGGAGVDAATAGVVFLTTGVTVSSVLALDGPAAAGAMSSTLTSVGFVSASL